MKRRALMLRFILPLAATAITGIAEPVATRQQTSPPAHHQPVTSPPATIQLPTPAPASPFPQKKAFTLADLKAQVPQNEKGHFQMEVPEILNTATDLDVQALLAGQSIETTGYIMVETMDKADGRHLRIHRAQKPCCSIHARQCSLAIDLPENAPTFKELAWVKLVGMLTYRREERKIVPVVTVSEITETPAPTNPVLQ